MRLRLRLRQRLNCHPRRLQMGLHLVRRHALSREQALQCGVFSRHLARNTLHVERGLRIAALVVPDAALQLLEQLAVACARPALVLAVESQRLWRAVLLLRLERERRGRE